AAVELVSLVFGHGGLVMLGAIADAPEANQWRGDRARRAKGDKIMSLTNFVCGTRRVLGLALLVMTARHLQAQAPAETKQASPSPAELTQLAAVIKPSA